MKIANYTIKIDKNISASLQEVYLVNQSNSQLNFLSKEGISKLNSEKEIYEIILKIISLPFPKNDLYNWKLNDIKENYKKNYQYYNNRYLIRLDIQSKLNNLGKVSKEEYQKITNSDPSYLSYLHPDEILDFPVLNFDIFDQLEQIPIFYGENNIVMIDYLKINKIVCNKSMVEKFKLKNQLKILINRYLLTYGEKINNEVFWGHDLKQHKILICNGLFGQFYLCKNKLSKFRSSKTFKNYSISYNLIAGA